MEEIQMFILNLTNPLTLLLILIATVLLIFLGQEIKKSYITVLPLIAHLAFLLMHTVQLLTLGEGLENYATILTRCIAIDFIFVLVTFFAYLWVDDIEAKAMNKKSIDNSLDWFWKKV